MKRKTRAEREEIKSRLLKTATPAEQRFALRLTMAAIPYQRQAFVGPYYADFLLADKIVVEIDGDSHKGRERNDQRGDAFMMRLGYVVIRIRNADVMSVDLASLTRNSKLVIQKKPKPARKARSNKPRTVICPFCRKLVRLTKAGMYIPHGPHNQCPSSKTFIADYAYAPDGWRNDNSRLVKSR